MLSNLIFGYSEKTDGLNLFFCFRSVTKVFAQHALLIVPLPISSWVLIAFKREFSFNDVLQLWEVLWTDYYTNDFVLFVALAVLESHRDVILRYLVEVSFPQLINVPILSPFVLADSLTKYSRSDYTICILSSVL